MLFTNLSLNNKKVVDCESVVCYIVEDQEKEWKINWKQKQGL
jgi:hypothetical protein